MHEDLDLSVIERHHDADPQFREAVRARLAAILDGSDALEVPDHPTVGATEEDRTMIDLETPRETDEHRSGPKRIVVAGLLVAAAVAAIAVVAIRKDDSVTPANQPSTTVTVAPTAPPQALSGTTSASGEQFAPGTYFVDDVAGSPTPRIFVTVGDGWSKHQIFTSLGVSKEGVGGIGFTRPHAVYKDACHWRDGLVEEPVTTLDGLVAAFSEQGGWVDVTPPSDISVDGYTGKTFQRTAPAELNDCDGMGDLGTMFRSWTDDGGNAYDYVADDVETLRFLDLNGTVIVISAVMIPGPADANAAAELAAVLDSIRIEPA